MTQHLCIDIGGTFIKSALIDDNLVLSHQQKHKTPDQLNHFLLYLESLIKDYHHQIKGVAISCPGQINVVSGYVYHGGLISYLKNFPLGKHLEEKYHLPVSVLNDADAAGLAESRYGSLKSCHYGAVLVLGTGVGLALVSDQNLMTFKDFSASDLWERGLREFKGIESLSQSLGLQINGIGNLITNTGSAVQFIKRASQILDLKKEDGQEVFEQLKLGQKENLQELFEKYCQDIAILILNLRNIFKLEMVAVGGGISQQALLIEEITKQYLQLLEEQVGLSNQLSQLPIIACSFQQQANLVGAYCQFKKIND